MHSFLNRHFDRLARMEIRLFRRPLPAYQVCGYTGFAMSVVQSSMLLQAPHLSLLVLWGMTGVVILTFYGLVMATKVLTGEEQIIYYHHEIAVMAMIALLLKLIHQPLLPYLDIGILGIGLFLAFGRVGCLMVGCCHGCPAKIGVCYKSEHARAGFPDSLVGVRLFPVQAVESLFVLSVVVLGDVLLTHGGRPGEALELYTVVYGCGRFAFEFVRGDIDRPYSFGFSQAQWISLILMSGMVWAEFRGALPFHVWHPFVLASLLVMMLVITAWRQRVRAPRHLLLGPRHLHEIADALKCIFDQASVSRQGTHICLTSLGIQISGGIISKPECATFYYALSGQNTPLPQAWARVLAGLILRLRHPLANVYQFTHGSSGVYHLLVPSSEK